MRADVVYLDGRIGQPFALNSKIPGLRLWCAVMFVKQDRGDACLILDDCRRCLRNGNSRVCNRLKRKELRLRVLLKGRIAPCISYQVSKNAVMENSVSRTHVHFSTFCWIPRLADSGLEILVVVIEKLCPRARPNDLEGKRCEASRVLE